MKSALLAIDDKRREEIPHSLEIARKLDLLWVLDINFNPDNTPMWVGWNSARMTTNNDQKKYGIYRRSISLHQL